MKKRRLSLGLDVSTQSITAVVLDIDSKAVVFEHSLDYCRDSRLNTFGIRQEDYIIPPEVEGEADQPAGMFFAALDAAFKDMVTVFSDLRVTLNPDEVVAVNTSGQQHGHVYLNKDTPAIFRELLNKDSADSDLVTLLKGSLARDGAPIWLTSNTAEQAEFVRDYVGGKAQMITLSGSDAPLRFSGVVIRRVGQQQPEIYRRTDRVQLISSLVPAVLTGNSDVPMDCGNGCGTALMDYTKKEWSDELVSAASDGLPGGKEGLMKKLPSLAAPDAIVGEIAGYFVRKYGFSPSCKIIAGSGDNPQSKVLVAGDLLSLGTSIVNMVSTDGKTLDMNGYANGMYDGVGRPFMFGARTNGVVVWDRLRATYGLEKKEYAPAEEALRKAEIARSMLFWQPRNESFPPSPAYDMRRVGDYTPGPGTDYAALIETTLATVYHYSKGFTAGTADTLYVTGGARNSREVLRRVAAIWNRPVMPIEAGGAALGAAVAGACAFLRSEGDSADVEEYVRSGILKRDEAFLPDTGDVAAFHRPGGYLDRFITEEARLIS